MAPKGFASAAIVLATCFLTASANVGDSFEGYTVLRTEPLTNPQSKDLSWLEQNADFDFWRPGGGGRSADIMASPSQLPHLKEFLESLGIKYEVMIEDVGRKIKETTSPNDLNVRTSVVEMTWEDYHSHATINAYVDKMAQTFDWVNSVSIGKTYEGRDMRVLQITKAGEGKPNIWIEAGIHAREWVAGAVGTYLIEMLLNSDEGKKYLDKLNFHILPMANPDGYEFSRSGKRLWRKTVSEQPGAFCKGVDANRNFDFHWGGAGSSAYKCSQAYAGTQAFSEVETRNIRDYVLSLKPSPILTHSLHSYSQLWLYPFGYDYNTLPNNADEIIALGEAAVSAIKDSHGQSYTLMLTSDLYPAGGITQDWYLAVAGARFSYTTELRDTGRHGFLLPVEEIRPCGEEIWAAEKVMMDKMIELTS